MTPSLSLPLAVVLLISPDFPAQEIPGVSYSLIRSTAKSLEILDERECRYFLTICGEYAHDVKTLRGRYQDLRCAPPLCDHIRFPGMDYCSKVMSLNREYKCFLEKRKKLGPSLYEELDVVIEETDHLYRIWDTVRDTKCEYYCLTTRRTALKKLREEIGEVNYYGGFLPPHVPVWRFNRID